jgi:hypothetical protein
MQLYHAIAGHFSDNVASSLVMAHGWQGEIRWIRGMIPDKSLMECMVASSIFCVLEAAKEMRGICFSIVARCVLITNYSICSRNLFMKEPACTWEQKWTLNWLQLAGRVNFSVRKGRYYFSFSHDDIWEGGVKKSLWGKNKLQHLLSSKPASLAWIPERLRSCSVPRFGSLIRHHGGVFPHLCAYFMAFQSFLQIALMMSCHHARTQTIGGGSTFSDVVAYLSCAALST